MTRPLTVVVAPDSFKGTATAADAADAIAAGWRSVRPNDTIETLPQADGGEGTLDALASCLPGAQRQSVGEVTGPDGRPVSGEWLLLADGGAVVELAQSSGITLMRELDPLGATTRGLGEVIRHALDYGISSLTIALGGSASTDGGAGALAALGLVLRDAHGCALRDGGGALSSLASVDRDGFAPSPPATLLVDVTSPMLGPAGAATVFGPQKGAGAVEIPMLERGLTVLAFHLGGDPQAPGMGAAGGAAYGFTATWGAETRSGAEFVMEATGLHSAIARADVVVTGEGRFDSQSVTGKVTGCVLAAGRSSGATTLVIAGSVEREFDHWSISLSDLAGSGDQARLLPLLWLFEAGKSAASSL